MRNCQRSNLMRHLKLQAAAAEDEELPAAEDDPPDEAEEAVAAKNGQLPTVEPHEAEEAAAAEDDPPDEAEEAAAVKDGELPTVESDEAQEAAAAGDDALPEGEDKQADAVAAAEERTMAKTPEAEKAAAAQDEALRTGEGTIEEDAVAKQVVELPPGGADDALRKLCEEEAKLAEEAAKLQLAREVLETQKAAQDAEQKTSPLQNEVAEDEAEEQDEQSLSLEAGPSKQQRPRSSRAGSPALRAASAASTPRTSRNELVGKPVMQHPLEMPTPARASSSTSRPGSSAAPKEPELPPSSSRSRPPSASRVRQGSQPPAPNASALPQQAVPLGADPLGALAKASSRQNSPAPRASAKKEKALPSISAPSSASELRKRTQSSSQPPPRETHSAEPISRRSDSLDPVRPQRGGRGSQKGSAEPNPASTMPRTPPKAGWSEAEGDVGLASQMRQRAEQIAMGQSMGAKDREDSLLRMLDNRQGRNRGVL
eukprot:TRINITY_DN2830_c0_g1_i4.p1 TRINITY_DN2830_c0_g1~~TRINITY_DN2830_c0_g1_i4.p1  ORF type:complete len:485 (-),score=148.17 TRINITY_DN2830_c0_g1_i4:47-1501(-)